MRTNTGRLFALILIAQSLCLAVGLGFHHLYISSALVQAEEDKVRGELVSESRAVSSAVKPFDLAELRADRGVWNEVVAHWRTAAEPADTLYLLDRQGRVVEE